MGGSCYADGTLAALAPATARPPPLAGRVQSRSEMTDRAPLPASALATPAGPDVSPEAGPLAELLDRGEVSAAEAERALVDIERVSSWMLGVGAVRRAVLAAVAADRVGGAGGWCLDLGAGSGHVGTDLLRAAAREGRSLRVVGVDSKLSHLLAGRRLGSPQLPVVADALALPLAAGALACAFSHLFFHHFDRATNRRVLAEMRRVARVAVVVVDLRRSAVARLLVRPFLRALRLSPVAYHDGVVSVARSYGLREVAATVAGLPVRELRSRFPFRWSLVLAGGAADQATSR
jgi:hypothetical protein